MATVGHFALMPGTLAFLDSFAGLIPCRVTAVDGPGDVTITVTAERRGYRRGDTERVTGNDRVARVVPRTAVYVRNGQYRIAGHPVVAYPAA